MQDNNKTPSGLISLDNVIWEFLGNIKAGEERYEDFLGYALDFYRDRLNNNGFIGIKSSVMTLTDYNTFKLPNDCIDWITIAVQVGMRLRKLVRDDTIVWNFKDLHSQGLLDVIVKDDQGKMNLYTTEMNARGEDVGQNFHVSEKHDLIGYFTENKDQREITVHPVNTTVNQVVLRYISDTYNKRNETLVPVTSIPAIKGYIDWKDHEHSTSDTKYRRALRKKDLFDLSYDEFLAMEADWNPEDITEIIYDNFSLTPNI